MAVKFRNYSAAVARVLDSDLNLTPHEVLVGNPSGGLGQVGGLGAAGTVLTSNGPGADPSFQPGGGGGGLRLPWDVMGGFIGSVCDPMIATSGVTGTLQAAPLGFICAVAIMAGYSTTANRIRMVGGGAMVGSGSTVILTDASGNLLASAVNPDPTFTGISSSLEYLTFTLSAGVPVTAGTIYYVMYLFAHATVTTSPSLWFSPMLPNWSPDPQLQTEVAVASGASSFNGTFNTIPNPQSVSGLTIDTVPLVWAALLP